MKVKKVIFSVGVAHPLYNKVVEAEIIKENAGYFGTGIYAKTTKTVHWPKNEHGILVYKNGNFVGYKTKEAFEEIWEGWCELA